MLALLTSVKASDDGYILHGDLQIVRRDDTMKSAISSAMKLILFANCHRTIHSRCMLRAINGHQLRCQKLQHHKLVFHGLPMYVAW